MDKLKGMLKISERDKKLLVVVLAVLIMALAYFFGFQNLSDQVDTLSTKKTTLETTQRDLKEKNNNKQKYVNDTMNYLKQYDNLLDRYAAGSTQPNSIDFFNKTESVTGTWVRSLSLSPTTGVKGSHSAKLSYKGGSYYCLAADPSIPFGTIIKITNHNLGIESTAYGIVVDRGGAIKKNHIDIFNGTEAGKYFRGGSSSNTQFEIVSVGSGKNFWK